ncbi:MULTISPECIES: UbiX family flavin prenyltransferase [Campylobacter]|uniref:UbiX family flavin prenyltransferase n=1 Tax=Campylobacter TaxID=194 RepID=UPI000A3558C2|nr:MULTISPECIES: UbiX family flavin prenyltransferase [unclassified Campylobacter]MCR8679712.1 UbiX family flavin prenyltransferase [Campylobacter sp. RM19072]MCR8696909.1 UbiX family flavin prenyltransferase [Campylobacter sp. RM19073]
MKLIVAISGASGAHLGIKLANTTLNLGIDTSVIITPNAKLSMQKENLSLDINEKIQIYDNSDISAPPASGSAMYDAMIVAPCSINTLAKISCGISDNLLLRAAAVMIKERRNLILGVRESPLSAISLRQMADLASMGVGIVPPILGYYTQPSSVSQIENFIIAKWLDSLNIKHNLIRRWNG